MDHLGVHKGQGIMPPQLLCHGPWLGLKIFQRYVICKDFSFMKSQVVIPWFKATHYHKQFFFMYWPFQLFASKGNWVSFLHQDPTYLHLCAPQKVS